MGEARSSSVKPPVGAGFRLDGLEVDPANGRISGPRGVEQVDPKVMDVLVALAVRPGELATREALLDTVWSDRVVTDDVLSRCIYQLRRHLVAASGSQGSHRLIETLPRRGYRLNGEVLPNLPVAGRGDRSNTAGWPRVMLLAVLLAAVAGWWVLDPGGADRVKDGAAADSVLIAVLPFVDLSAERNQEYFADGVSEELINHLSKIPPLRVMARSSSFSFKGENPDIVTVANKLNVSHVLEGSVRRSGDRVRITAQLIDAAASTHLWSETFERDFDDIFAIQDEIAIAVVDALKITLLGEVPKKRKTDSAAYQLFLEGLYLKRQLSRDSLLKAIEAFNEAVEIDPSYAPAWAELADTYFWIVSSEKFSREEGIALADQAIESAISIDPDYAFVYYVRGISWIFGKKQFKRGIEDFEYALELEPDNAFMIAAIGKGALVTGKFDLAITQFQEALALEPVVPEFHYYLSKAYLSSGRLDEAEASFRKTLDLSPTAYGNPDLWETLFLKGELEAALEQTDLLEFPISALAITHYALGDFAKADDYLEELIEFGVDANAYSIARVYGYRGETDKTFEWLNYMWERNNTFPTLILGDTALHSVYSDPRWQPFLEKLGLLEIWLEMPSKHGPYRGTLVESFRGDA